MTVHVKKVWPEFFGWVRTGQKPFEWRKEDDCRYEIGDLMILLEFKPGDRYLPGTITLETKGYTGRVLKRRVTYVLRDQFEMPKGYVVLGLRELEEGQEV